MADATHTLNIIIKVTNKATKQVKKVEQDVKKMGKSISNVTQSVGKFQRALQGVLLGVGLSFLFTGMAIKKFFEGILKGLVSTFLTVMGETSAQAQQVNSLKASWEFLKFKIMDALIASGLWDVTINKIKELIAATTEWVKDNPKATAELVKIAAIIAVSATIMMVLGQVLLGILGVATLFYGVFQLVAFLFSGTILAGLAGILLGVLGVLAIALLLRAKFGSWKNVLIEVGNTVFRLLVFPFQLILKIVVDIIDLIGTAARALGKTGLAADLNSAAANLEGLMRDIDSAVTIELDDSVIPNTTREGLLDMVGLTGLADLLSGTGGATTQDNSQTTNNNEFTVYVDGSNMSLSDLQAYLDEQQAQGQSESSTTS